MMLWPNELDPENALQLLLEVVVLSEVVLLLSVLEVVVLSEVVLLLPASEVVVLSEVVLLLSVLEVAPTDCVGCADWPDEPPQPAGRTPKLTTTPNFLAMTWSMYSLLGSLFNLYGTIA